jgi:hypothetical protein
MCLLKAASQPRALELKASAERAGVALIARTDIYDNSERRRLQI